MYIDGLHPSPAPSLLSLPHVKWTSAEYVCTSQLISNTRKSPDIETKGEREREKERGKKKTPLIPLTCL